ncbi:hypothetical protein [Virgibacillus sp. YIM 98842]|jgi:hypothetical protein|uniref:hypothetical protein n=1 Tax=Virgibacillus sp. YIM 98842 TaxID=2663533 RepID=UPI0013D97DAA|nr:hypothetical protein [Virgibacillus sp. YIM 98842]
MDKEFVEKVTRMVISSLEEMKGNGIFSNQQAVKIWPHKSPLPDPVVLTHVKAEKPENGKSIVTFSPYV